MKVEVIDKFVRRVKVNKSSVEGVTTENENEKGLKCDHSEEHEEESMCDREKTDKDSFELTN